MKELDAAQRAVDQGDYGKALRLLRPLAEAGNPKAQGSLGVLFQLGLGVQRDLAEALKWLRKAAGQGDGLAAHNIGTIYLTGAPEIPNDEAKSEEWFRRARELGFEPGRSE